MEVKKQRRSSYVCGFERGRRNFLFFCSCYMWHFLKWFNSYWRKSFPAGRMGEKPSVGLTESLKSLGHGMGRLKTGTPPRLFASSINWSLTKPSPGDDTPSLFSIYSKRPLLVSQEPCFIVNTNLNVHSVINKKH